MAKRAKKNRKFIIKCAHCNEADFKLVDVNPDEQIKYYTDTPFKNALNKGTPLSGRVKLKDALLSPSRFKIEDETALKTNYMSSSNGKAFHTPIKEQNLEELALGLPNLILDDSYLQKMRSPQCFSGNKVN
jgi:hypothetical protein